MRQDVDQRGKVSALRMRHGGTPRGTRAPLWLPAAVPMATGKAPTRSGRRPPHRPPMTTSGSLISNRCAETLVLARHGHAAILPEMRRAAQGVLGALRRPAQPALPCCRGRPRPTEAPSLPSPVRGDAHGGGGKVHDCAQPIRALWIALTRSWTAMWSSAPTSPAAQASMVWRPSAMSTSATTSATPTTPSPSQSPLQLGARRMLNTPPDVPA